MTSSVRKDWDTYFMDIAFMASTRSRCPRRHVGAVLVQGKKTAGFGIQRRADGGTGLLRSRLHDCGRIGAIAASGW